jgi:uncharacterized protein (UPF0332 family)
MDIKTILRKGIIEELNGAESEFKIGRYKNALILYSKTIFSMCDYLILIKGLRLPKEHSDRFRILEQYLPNIYKIVDKIFKIY